MGSEEDQELRKSRGKDQLRFPIWEVNTKTMDGKEQVWEKN